MVEGGLQEQAEARRSGESSDSRGGMPRRGRVVGTGISSVVVFATWSGELHFGGETRHERKGWYAPPGMHRREIGEGNVTRCADRR